MPEYLEARIAALDGPNQQIKEHITYLNAQLSKAQADLRQLQNDRLFELYVAHFTHARIDPKCALRAAMEALQVFMEAAN